MLSHRLVDLSSTKQTALFPESFKDRSWENTAVQKRYFLNFPFYPFRTLNTRSLSILAAATSSSSISRTEFDYSSPIFPAHTQINMVFQKRKKPDNFLLNMLPYQLDPNLGSAQKKLSATQWKQTVTFIAEAIDADNKKTTTKYVIKKVEIQVNDVYLQVSLILILFFVSVA
jgi:hypothetical protein